MRHIQALAGVLVIALPILSVGCAAEDKSAQYAGSQEKLANARAASESRTQSDRAEFTALMIDPSLLTDPAKLQRLIILGMLDPDPNIARNTPRIITLIFSNAAAAGNQGVAQAQADRLAAQLGVVAYGDTMTGMNERMAANRHIARIQADATISAARAQTEAAMIVARSQASIQDNVQAKTKNLSGN